MDEFLYVQRKAKLFPNHEKKLIHIQSKMKNDKLGYSVVEYRLKINWNLTSLMYEEIKTKNIPTVLFFF